LLSGKEVNKRKQQEGRLGSSHPWKKAYQLTCILFVCAEDERELKQNTEVMYSIMNWVVAEHSVDRWNLFGKRDGGIRRENADISNDKYCEKQYRRKRKVFYVKIICVELDRTLRFVWKESADGNVIGDTFLRCCRRERRTQCRKRGEKDLITQNRTINRHRFVRRVDEGARDNHW